MKVHQGTGIKDTWTKPKGVGLSVGGEDGWGGGHGGVKMETPVLEQQQKKEKNIYIEYLV